MIHIRPATIADATALSSLYTANWSFLEPWEPARDDTFLTPAGQEARLAMAEAEREGGTSYRCVICDDQDIVGMVSLSAIERGPVQSAHLGYWVAQAANGRGVATTAVAAMLELAFGGLGLHRLQAGTLVHNAGSQKVLMRNGFERIGLAKSYLKIAGEWQDHILFQRLAYGDASPR